MPTSQENLWYYSDGVSSFGPLGSSAVRQMIAVGVIQPTYTLRRDGENFWRSPAGIDLDASHEEPSLRHAANSVHRHTANPQRIYVSNMVPNVSEQDLIELFEGIGAVRKVKLTDNNGTSLSKGFGIVEMFHKEDVIRAVAVLQGQPFMGRRLTVSAIEPKGLDEWDDEDCANPAPAPAPAHGHAENHRSSRQSGSHAYQNSVQVQAYDSTQQSANTSPGSGNSIGVVIFCVVLIIGVAAFWFSVLPMHTVVLLIIAGIVRGLWKTLTK